MDRHPRLLRRIAATMAILFIAGSPVESTDPIQKARELRKNGDPAAAARVLEAALSGAVPARRATLMLELRAAYEAAIRKAEDAGRKTEADRYRDNLEILGRGSKPPKLPPATEPIATPPIDPPKPAGSVTEMADPPSSEAIPEKIGPRFVPSDPPSAPDPFEPLAPKLNVDPNRGEDDPPKDDSVDRAGQIKAVADSPPQSSTVQAPLPPVAKPPAQVEPRDDLAVADEAFQARRFDEAGRIYASLAKTRALPEARRDAWAYCRCHEVVRRINAGPKSADEWAAIRAETEQIRVLSPKLWYAEYLRNLVAERSGSKPKAKSRRPILRGASPEEPPVSPASAPNAARVGKPAGAENGWKVWETANFRILHLDDALAEKAARVLEASRVDHFRRWTGAEPSSVWTPRCDVYLYPTAAQFQKATGQGEESPGFSTMGMGGGRVVERRITLRADNPKLLPAVMPHEVTHVVLADLFPTSQIPRWADEGISVLSEPAAEQRLRDAELSEPLAQSRVFRLQDLMVMDYPEGERWGLYYAQSVSLTRFLVERGSPETFIKFVQNARANGLEAELKRSYHIEGFADLERLWREHARSRITSLAAAEGQTKGR